MQDVEEYELILQVFYACARKMVSSCKTDFAGQVLFSTYCTGDGAKDGLWTLDWTTVLCKLVGTLKVVPEKTLLFSI